MGLNMKFHEKEKSFQMTYRGQIKKNVGLYGYRLTGMGLNKMTKTKGENSFKQVMQIKHWI